MGNKKLDQYLPSKPRKKPVPARITEETIKRAQFSARKRKIPLCDFIEGAINMACDQDSVKAK